jgi:ABC-type spermidine/putrescine transport system permease subunit II
VAQPEAPDRGIPLPASPAGSALDRGLGRAERSLVVGLAVLAVIFLMLPVIIVIPMSFSGAQLLTFPPPSLSLRWYDSFFGDPAWLSALLNSVVVALASSVLALILGTLAAYGLVRFRFFGRAVLEANYVAPLIIPPIIAAVALYIVFAQAGLLGSYEGLIIAHTLHSAPYIVLVMTVAIAAFDVRIEQVARSLGASQRVILLRILLPNLAPSVVASWMLAFIVSFDEVILTLFLFGNRETIPKRMFTRLELQIDPTITAIATMLIVFSVAALAVVYLLTRRGGRALLGQAH